MKKFQFKLQTVLDQRKSREDHLLEQLGEVRREEALEVARLDALRNELRQAGVLIVEGLTHGAPPMEMARRDEYAKAKRDDVRVQELTLEAVRQRVEIKRLEVVEAMKQRKVMEALRDRQESAYILACARAEQNELDAMASLRYARGM
jgi:flagellar protein FliJ